ncbi:uncharacterized protein LOC131336468 [Rhododendron vialii]|uniref:uncharacterized protein LOC131336468 n=1 Tax=Rhododendron vialii TaxID=182163 RepID=UPI0026600336|nr:uncharacterized protein LOC131336468 [Rhododendron vialii]XP_058228309.1 uncharacterized protein LOC131336468 [Rhododendron vialii]
MDLDSVKRYLEKDCNENAMNIDGMPFKFFEPFVMQGLRVDLLEPGRIICSMKVPPRLLNTGDFLHGGATATLVDLVGSAVIYTVGAPVTGVSVEINVSYLDAAYAGVSALLYIYVQYISLYCFLSTIKVFSTLSLL